MDLNLILDPPVNLSFGNLTDRDFRDLAGEVEAFGTAEPVFTAIARAFHVALTARARGRYMVATLRLPRTTPEQAKQSAERVRHLVESATGRAALQEFLCEVCLALLLEPPSRGSKNIRLPCEGYAGRIGLVNKLLLDEED